MGVRRVGRASFTAALLLVSGAAALAHEAAWQRLWSLYAGAGVATSAAVVAGTLLGLGTGSAFGGSLADRVRRPGLVFALAELLGGAAALCVPSLVTWRLAAGAPGSVQALVEVACACALPSAFLGASLPAAVRAIEPARGRAGPLLSLLYAANTLGAVVGVLGATGFGIEALGIRGTVRLAAAGQGLVALLGLLLPAVGEVAAPAPPPAGGGPERGPGGRYALAAALAGAAGLAVEIAWVRRLTPALGTTSYAFGTVLGVYLLGVALGAALLGPHRARPAGRAPALVCALAALPVAGLAWAVLPVAHGAGAALAAALADGTAGAGTLIRIRALAAAVVLVPTTAIGAAALPWLLHAADPDPARAGRATGRVLAANTVGSAAAALLAGAFGIPVLGTAGTLRAAAALYLGAAAAATGPGRARLAFGTAALLVLVTAALPLPDAAGRDAVGATFDPGWTDPAAAPATYFAEGRVSTVVVRDRDGRPELWVDGKVVASAAPTDRLHLSLLGHVPMCLHPNPRRVAVVGLGTGITSTACALHAPEVLDVFELEAHVRAASEAFRGAGGGAPASARVHVVDGRIGLLAAEAPYDVITTDPIHPAAAGSAALYTREHYEGLRAHLAPGGIVCQWLPLYEVSTEDVRTMLRTFASVFEPFVFVAGPDLVIVGLPLGTPALDGAAVAGRFTPAVRAALDRFGLGTPGRLLGMLLAGPARVRTFAGDGPWNTDDRPILEFSSARSQYTGSSTENLTLLSVGADARAAVEPPPGDEAFRADMERSRRLRRALADWMRGDAAGWRAALERVEKLDEESPDLFVRTLRDECEGLLALALARAGEAEEAVAHARALLARGTADPKSQLDAADALRVGGEGEEARRAAAAVSARIPGSARARRLAGA